MTKALTLPQKQIISRIFMYLATIAAVLLLIVGGLALWAHNFTGNMVQSELAAQKIYFPKKGAASFSPTTYPDLQQYAGQLVDSPAKAKAYANGYIGRHLQAIANGKVYAEVGAEAAKDPTNVKLQQQKQLLFQGDTLRGILLTSGYGFGTIGILAGIASIVAFSSSLILFVTALMLRAKL